MKFLSTFFNTSEKKRLFENFFFLSILQSLNLLLPLLTFPYLVRVVGVEKFGLFAFAMSFMSYFTIISDYGFNLTATKAVSMNRNKKSKLNEIFSAVLVIKLILTIFCCLLLLLLSFNINRLYNDRTIFILAFGNVVGQTLFPTWFFQGIEQMKHITIINVATKMVFTCSIFIFVKDCSDFILVPTLLSIGSIMGGAYGLWLIKSQYGLTFSMQSKEVIIEYFKEGWQIFVSSFAINIYLSSNTLILGLLTNNTLVGYYSIAEKIVTAIRSLVGVAFQAIFPFVCNLAKRRNHLRAFYQKFLALGGSFFFMAGLSLAFFGSTIISIFVQNDSQLSNNVLKVLCMVPFIVYLNIPAYQSLLIFDPKQIYAKILISASFFNIVLNVILALNHGPIGTAYAVLVTEIYITMRLNIAWSYCKKRI